MASLDEQAKQLDRAARNHTRAARRERRRAKELLAQLDRVIALAAERGIEINVKNHRPAHEGEPSGNRNHATPDRAGQA